MDNYYYSKLSKPKSNSKQVTWVTELVACHHFGKYSYLAQQYSIYTKEKFGKGRKIEGSNINTVFTGAQNGFTELSHRDCTT